MICLSFRIKETYIILLLWHPCFPRTTTRCSCGCFDEPDGSRSTHMYSIHLCLLDFTRSFAWCSGTSDPRGTYPFCTCLHRAVLLIDHVALAKTFRGKDSRLCTGSDRRCDTFRTFEGRDPVQHTLGSTLSSPYAPLPKESYRKISMPGLKFRAVGFLYL